MSASKKPTKATVLFDREGSRRLRALTDCGSRDKDRPVLCAVAFGPEDMAATDSYVLGLLPYDLPGCIFEGELSERVVVDAFGLRSALTPQLKVGEWLAVELGDGECLVRRWKVHKALTFSGVDDLPDWDHTTRVAVIDGKFPIVEKLLPKKTNGGSADAFNPHNLHRVAALASTFGAHSGSVTLHSSGDLKPCVVRNGDRTAGLVMPMRTS